MKKQCVYVNCYSTSTCEWLRQIAKSHYQSHFSPLTIFFKHPISVDSSADWLTSVPSSAHKCKITALSNENHLITQLSSQARKSVWSLYIHFHLNCAIAMPKQPFVSLGTANMHSYSLNTVVSILQYNLLIGHWCYSFCTVTNTFTQDRTKLRLVTKRVLTTHTSLCNHS